jgi:hypothetical protein
MKKTLASRRPGLYIPRAASEWADTKRNLPQVFERNVGADPVATLVAAIFDRYGSIWKGWLGGGLEGGLAVWAS